MNYTEYDSYQLKFSTVYAKLKQNEEIEIIVTFGSKYPRRIQDTIEIIIEHSEPMFMNIYADCQEAFAYIANPIIKPTNILLSTPINADDNMIKLVNPSNLQIHFKWENIFESEKRVIEFSPQSGIIEPNSFVIIKHKMIYYTSNYF
jgi:hypothetical protein